MVFKIKFKIMKTSTETRNEVQVSAKFSLNQLVEKKKKKQNHTYMVNQFIIKRTLQLEKDGLFNKQQILNFKKYISTVTSHHTHTKKINSRPITYLNVIGKTMHLLVITQANIFKTFRYKNFLNQDPESIKEQYKEKDG